MVKQTPEERTEELSINMVKEVKRIVTRYSDIVTNSDDMILHTYLNGIAGLCAELLSLLGSFTKKFADDKKVISIFEQITEEAFKRMDILNKQIKERKNG